MIVTYLGGSSFRLQSGEVSVLTDPQNNRFKSDVLLRTEVLPEIRHFEPGEIAWPGEYEVKGLEIRGWPAPHEAHEKTLKTVYRVRFEEMSFVFLGRLAKFFDGDLLQEISDADALFVSPGPDRAPAAQEIQKFVKQAEPRFVVVGYPGSQEAASKILNQKAELREKLVFKKKDLASVRQHFVLLENAGKPVEHGDK